MGNSVRIGARGFLNGVKIGVERKNSGKFTDFKAEREKVGL